MRQDLRKAGGLNNAKYPLRLIVRTVERHDLAKVYDGRVPRDYELECGHRVVDDVNGRERKRRRCYLCGEGVKASERATV